MKQRVGQEYCEWKGGTDGKEADGTMMFEMLSPKTSQHLMMLQREDDCSAGESVEG